MLKTEQRYAVEFVDNGRRIDVVYWIKNYQVMGEAYFHHDDYCAEVVNGTFIHPYADITYRMYVPVQGSAVYKDCILDKLAWVNVGRGEPKPS